MRKQQAFVAAMFLLAIIAFSAGSFAADKSEQKIALDSMSGLKLIGVKSEVATYRGRKAVRLLEDAAPDAPHAIALIPGTDFADGTIEVDVVGLLTPTAQADFRGFVGFVFRSAPDGSKYENFYIRPTNGRAEVQIRRNHATQYTSYPDFPWHKLRKENPGEYESYADMVAGDWTKLRAEISGNRARFFVNGAEQPQLIVNDLKHGQSSGLVGLWIGAGTDAYFSNLRITRAATPSADAK
jgi:hypothetical protein